MLRLPEPNRANLKSFWLVVSLAAGLATGVALRAAAVPLYPLLGLLAALGVAVLGLRRPAIAAGPYGAWDRLARIAGRGARLWLTAICFLILALVGRLGSRLTWRKPAASASGWVPKRPLPGDSYTSMSDLPRRPDSQSGWVRSLTAWAGRSGHVWAWSLLPLLVLLRAVEGSPKGSLGGNVYTLY